MLKKGDNVFYCDNAPDSDQYTRTAAQAIQSLDLRPVLYKGAGKTTRSSSLGTEITDDLYASQVAVVRLGSPSDDDNWALSEREEVEKRGIRFLCYINVATPAIAGASAAGTLVTGHDDFAMRLKRDLAELMDQTN